MPPAPSVDRRSFVARALRALAVGGCASSAGCTMFLQHLTDWSHVDERPARTAEAPGREAVQVEIVFVERPLDDPLMGDRLWQDLDQVGAVDGDVRTKLESHGFRVGHCGATPPRPLQKLLGLRAQIIETGPGAESKALAGQRIGLPAGDDYEIQVSNPYPHCAIQLDPADETKVRDFQGARCLLRLSAKRMQDGWVELDLQPEIHHGDHRLRRVATEGGFRLRQSQEVVPVYALRFQMPLGMQEMAVIGFEPSATRSLGHHFLVGANDSAQLQRLLVVRVVGVTRSEFVAAE